MDSLFSLLGIGLMIIGLGCGLIILIEAFTNEIWKGVVCLLCGLYMLYYALFEFDSDKKWLVVLGFLGGSGVGRALLFFAN